LYGNTVLLEKKTWSVLKKWEEAVRNCTDIQIGERQFVATTIPFMFSPIYGHISFNILLNQVRSNCLNKKECEKGILLYLKNWTYFPADSSVKGPNNFAYNKIGLIRLVSFISFFNDLPLNGSRKKAIKDIVSETLTTKTYRPITDLLKDPLISSFKKDNDFHSKSVSLKKGVLNESPSCENKTSFKDKAGQKETFTSLNEKNFSLYKRPLRYKIEIVFALFLFVFQFFLLRGTNFTKTVSPVDSVNTTMRIYPLKGGEIISETRIVERLLRRAPFVYPTGIDVSTRHTMINRLSAFSSRDNVESSSALVSITDNRFPAVPVGMPSSSSSWRTSNVNQRNMGHPSSTPGYTQNRLASWICDASSIRRSHFDSCTTSSLIRKKKDTLPVIIKEPVVQLVEKFVQSHLSGRSHYYKFFYENFITVAYSSKNSQFVFVHSPFNGGRL
jgi:hypothetical protein